MEPFGKPLAKLSSDARWTVAAAVVLASGLAGFAVSEAPAPSQRSIDVTARSYAFEPATIRVRRGDLVTLRFASLDVVHGFALEGYDVDVAIHPLSNEVALRNAKAGAPGTWVRDVSFVADRPGKYRYRCSVTCGAMHPFMVGELIVEPNRVWPTSAALAVGILMAGLVLVAQPATEETDGPE